jgi:glycosyltransferase involved in cell wall biosynthesis
MGPPMRFAILGSRGYPSTYSGYETLVRHLAPFLHRAGHDVTVYGRESGMPATTWVDGIRCVSGVGIDSKSLSTLSYGLSSTVDAMFRHFDAVLVVNIANGLWLPLLRAAHIPTAVNTDGIEWERGKWNRFGKKVFKVGARFTSKHAGVLIADSGGIAELWEEEFGRTSTFIPYGAPIEPEVPANRLSEIGLDGERFLLSVARLVPENNVDLTLDTLELLEDPELTVVVVGSGEEQIANRLRSLDRAGRLRWLGHVSDQELLVQLWAHCTVYVHGHSVGGTNPSLLQAMGAGAPVLALNTRFNAEVLDNPSQLYDREPSSLRLQLEKVLADDSLRENLVRRQWTRLESDYSWPDVCNRYMKVLETVASGHS